MFSIILVTTMILGLGGCSNEFFSEPISSETQTSTPETEAVEEKDSSFVVVEDALQYSIIYHRDTR